MRNLRDKVVRGRGTSTNPAPRFLSRTQEPIDDGWDLADEPSPAPETTVRPEQAKSILSFNQSPDIGFDRSVNPYRGCEHGCIYCYARPAHAYVDLSPGLDFETRLFYKANAAQLLEKALRKPGYQARMISLGANTDPYQPIEKQYRITRSLLEVLRAYRHPVGIVSKGASLMRRDLDLLADMASKRLLLVAISVTTLRDELKRSLEPRTSSTASRLKLIRTLSEAGIPVIVMASPMIPFINDAELESILSQGRQAGAIGASYILLRLPHEVRPLFEQWLQDHEPLKAKHVMSLMTQMHQGQAYDARFFARQRGHGPFADLLEKRYQKACKRLGFEFTSSMSMTLDTSNFAVPLRPLFAEGPQQELF